MQISMCKKVCVFFVFVFQFVCSYMLGRLNMSGVWMLILQQFQLLICFFWFCHFFTVSGNPGVVQCQGVFQQNVSHFPANHTLHQNNSQSDCSDWEHHSVVILQSYGDGPWDHRNAFTLFATLNGSYQE